jgi:hypothetical protein
MRKNKRTSLYVSNNGNVNHSFLYCLMPLRYQSIVSLRP